MKPLYPLLINQGIAKLINADIPAILHKNNTAPEPVTDNEGKKYYSDMLFKLTVVLEALYPIEGIPLEGNTFVAQYANNIHCRTKNIQSLSFQKNFETASKHLRRILKSNNLILDIKAIHQALMISYQIKCAYFDDYQAKITSFEYIKDENDLDNVKLTVVCE